MRVMRRYETGRRLVLDSSARWAATSPRQTVMLICLVLGVAALLKLCAQLGSALCIASVQTEFVHDLTRRLYRHCLFHDFAFYRWFPPGKLLTRLSIDIVRMQGIVELVYGTRIRQPVNLVFLAVLLCAIHLKLALAVFAFSCVFVLPVAILSRKLRAVSRKEVGLDATYRVGEPNTWREILATVDAHLSIAQSTVAIQSMEKRIRA